MALNREKKQKIIEDLKEKIKRQKAIIFLNISGLKTRDLFELREKLKEKDSLLKVAKKTLTSLAFKDFSLKLAEKIKELKGNLALVFGFSDEILPAKTVFEFLKENENLKILGGIMKVESLKAKVKNYEFLAPEEIISLAQLPTKKELLAKLVNTIKSPILNFLNILEGNIKGLIYILANIKK
jgi:large subunit ribosomal protein L10